MGIFAANKAIFMSVIFDQLRIADDGKKLFIDAHVNLASQFEETTIDSLYIVLESQVYETRTIDPESNGYIYKKTYENVKAIHEVIDISDENLIYNKTTFSDLLFVYVGCSNLPEDKDCYASVGKYFLNVTFDVNLLHQRVMGFTKQLAEDCQTPNGFIDFILLWNAFKAAVETEHFIPAIEYYNMLFSSYGAASNTSKHCGCHG